MLYRLNLKLFCTLLCVAFVITCIHSARNRHKSAQLYTALRAFGVKNGVHGVRELSTFCHDFKYHNG